ncbi:Cytochrome c [Crateriforma conspicua]|uniref:Cytochrome c n=1 Tax=Crateriforma conspicua TaxID=2527996 RepID=A0A5C6FZD1_9PLAN|nr:c-type cytochrome [Crateriforma conspicua]TWU66660.1 Cytochrome c [Crateriforma conspicua]
MIRSSTSWKLVIAAVVALPCVFVWSTWADTPPQSAESASPMPDGPLADVIRLGQKIVNETDTHPLSKPFVGNALACRSCHLDGGTHPKAASFLNVATAYPAWSPREQRVITLEDRALNCFMRSMNGTRPPNGSEVSVAITTYITWLSKGETMAMNPSRPLGPNHVRPLAIDPSAANLERGETLYADHCAYCHGQAGEGGDDGPPVWGDESYNDGAGLARNAKLASWLKVAMPLDDPYLTEQQSLDVAAYINSHSRPKFILEEHLPSPDRMGEYNGQEPPK